MNGGCLHYCATLVPILMSSSPDIHHFSRRGFLKSTTCLTLGSLAAGPSLAAALSDRSGIAIVVAPGDGVASAVPPQWAVGELKTALEAQGATVRIVGRVADAAASEFCVVAGGVSSPLAQTILRQRKISGPTEAESLCLVPGEAEADLCCSLPEPMRLVSFTR